jgi:hypothetical protein
VKDATVAMQQARFDVPVELFHMLARVLRPRRTTVLSNIFHRRPAQLVASNENLPECDPEAPVSREKMRALGTEAALAVSVDTSPAVLVNIQHYAHAQLHRHKGRRTA